MSLNTVLLLLLLFYLLLLLSLVLLLLLLNALLLLFLILVRLPLNPLLLLFLFARIMPRFSSMQQYYQSFVNLLPAFATVMPRKPTTSRPAIVRRRSTAGLADDPALGEGDSAGSDGLGSAVDVEPALGAGVSRFDEGRHAARMAAAAARAAPRK